MNDKIYPSMVIRSQAEAIELLEKENKKYKEVIDKAIEYIKQHSNNLSEYLDVYEAKEILDILKEVE